VVARCHRHSAAVAQMQSGETILSVDGMLIPNWQELRWTLLDLALQQSEVRIEARSAEGEPLLHVLDSRIEASDWTANFRQAWSASVPPTSCRSSPAHCRVSHNRRFAGGRYGPARQRDCAPSLDELVEVVRLIRQTVLPISGAADCAECDLGANMWRRGACRSARSVRHRKWTKGLEGDANEVSYNPITAFVWPCARPGRLRVTLKMMGKMVLRISEELSAPLPLPTMRANLRNGISAYLGFLALSASVWVLNLLPILIDGDIAVLWSRAMKGSLFRNRHGVWSERSCRTARNADGLCIITM